MRDKPPPVPLVIAASGYKAGHSGKPEGVSEGSAMWQTSQAHPTGFIQVPWDFTVDGLCDILEEHPPCCAGCRD